MTDDLRTPAGEEPHASPSSEATGEVATPKGSIVNLMIGLVVVSLIAGYSVYVQTNEGTSTVVTRFGRPVQVIESAGPGIKWPWPIEQAHVIDRRLAIFNTPYTETITKDQRSVVLHSYIIWSVTDPLRFHVSVGSRATAEDKLGLMVTNAKNRELGNYVLANLVSTDPDTIRTAEIEQRILKSVNERASAEFGLQIEQVGIKRIAFSEENIPSVIAKMRANRKAVAQELRAEGRKTADGILSDALASKEEEIRKGVEEAGRIRGGALKEVSGIYREVYQLDRGREFYEFYRALEENKRMLGPNATIYLTTDHEFFPLLEDRPSGERLTPRAAVPPPAANTGVGR
ncbi:MAG: protease modulator HflC [Planctomycetaceae bacterium]